MIAGLDAEPPPLLESRSGKFLMEFLVHGISLTSQTTRLEYSWGPSFLGILTTGTVVTRSSRSLRCARPSVPPPPLDAKTFSFLSFPCSTCSGCRGLSVVLAGGSIRRSTPPPLCNQLRETEQQTQITDHRDIDQVHRLLRQSLLLAD